MSRAHSCGLGEGEGGKAKEWVLRPRVGLVLSDSLLRLLALATNRRPRDRMVKRQKKYFVRARSWKKAVRAEPKGGVVMRQLSLGGWDPVAEGLRGDVRALLMETLEGVEFADVTDIFLLCGVNSLRPSNLMEEVSDSQAASRVKKTVDAVSGVVRDLLGLFPTAQLTYLGVGRVPFAPIDSRHEALGTLLRVNNMAEEVTNRVREELQVMAEAVRREEGGRRGQRILGVHDCFSKWEAGMTEDRYGHPSTTGNVQILRALVKRGGRGPCGRFFLDSFHME